MSDNKKSFKNILSGLKIDESRTKAVKRPKVFTKIKDTVAPIPHYNYMMDLLVLPTTKAGFHLLLVCVDLATKAFDIEPLKTKTAGAILDAFKEMMKRPYIKLPFASVQTDEGSEFKGTFDKFLKQHGIFHNLTMPDRHIAKIAWWKA